MKVQIVLIQTHNGRDVRILRNTDTRVKLSVSRHLSVITYKFQYGVASFCNNFPYIQENLFDLSQVGQCIQNLFNEYILQ
jgi:hypothetical protein